MCKVQWQVEDWKSESEDGSIGGKLGEARRHRRVPEIWEGTKPPRYLKQIVTTSPTVPT